MNSRQVDEHAAVKPESVPRFTQDLEDLQLEYDENSLSAAQPDSSHSPASLAETNSLQPLPYEALCRGRSES